MSIRHYLDFSLPEECCGIITLWKETDLYKVSIGTGTPSNDVSWSDRHCVGANSRALAAILLRECVSDEKISENLISLFIEEVIQPMDEEGGEIPLGVLYDWCRDAMAFLSIDRRCLVN